MQRYLSANQVLLKDFAAHVEQVTQGLKEASLADAEPLGRPMQYLPSPQASKEEIARGGAAWRTCTAGPRSPGGRPNATWTPSPAWTTT